MQTEDELDQKEAELVAELAELTRQLRAVVELRKRLRQRRE